MTYQPTVLVLSSGSNRGLGQLGALIAPYEEGFLRSVNTIVGCSVGSIIGYLMAIGCKPYEIMVLGLSINLFEKGLQPQRLQTEYALCDHALILDLLVQVSLLKLRKLPTLQELYTEHGIRLIIPTVNLNLPEPAVEYLDYLSDPELSALEAVKRSISIQPLFPPVVVGEKYYVDGALIDPFPIDLLDDGRHEILGVHTELIGGIPQGFVEHISMITTVLVDQVKRMKIERASSRVKLITVRLENQVLSDDLTSKLQMYYLGYFEGLRFVEEVTKGKCKRD